MDVSCRDFVPPEKACSDALACSLLLWDAVPHPAKGAFLKKRPLGTLKNFFRFVKAKPDGLSVFRAGTWSRLKRLGLFRSCRREASSKTQGLSEDASHHAREHKTPTEGTANDIHRPAPKNQQLRYFGFLTLPLKVCCLSAEKVFGSTPFSKGVAGLQGGSPARSIGQRAGHTKRLKKHDCDGNAVDKPIFLRYTIHCRNVSWNEQSERKVK